MKIVVAVFAGLCLATSALAQDGTIWTQGTDFISADTLLKWEPRPTVIVADDPSTFVITVEGQAYTTGSRKNAIDAFVRTAGCGWKTTSEPSPWQPVETHNYMLAVYGPPLADDPLVLLPLKGEPKFAASVTQESKDLYLDAYARWRLMCFVH